MTNHRALTRHSKDRKDPIRLGVLLSGSGTTLENLFVKIDEGVLPAVVAVVVSSNRSAFGLARAARRLVPAEVVPWTRFRDAAAFSRAVTGHLEAAKVDLVIMAGFLRLYIIPPVYEGKVMNIHPALIPKFCGKNFFGHHVHEAVIAAGERESGCTVHFADNEYDHGPIIVQRKVPVLPGDTADALAARVFQEECLAYPEAIRKFAAGEIDFRTLPRPG